MNKTVKLQTDNDAESRKQFKTISCFSLLKLKCMCTKWMFCTCFRWN